MNSEHQTPPTPIQTLMHETYGVDLNLALLRISSVAPDFYSFFWKVL